MADPNKLFVAIEYSRTQIADEFNNYLSDDDALAADDDRLTDEVCERYVEFVGDSYQMHKDEDDFDSEEAVEICRILKSMGLTPFEDFDTDEE